MQTLGGPVGAVLGGEKNLQKEFLLAISFYANDPERADNIY